MNVEPFKNEFPGFFVEKGDRVLRLWRVPNLPQSVQCLLEVFYQRRLEFEQVDLVVLEAVGRCIG